jgi:hypothetical protein
MGAWTSDDLDRVGGAEEPQLASRSADGTLRGFVTMWVVRAGDELYVRSAGGPDRPWYLHATPSRAGPARAGSVERYVTFTDASADAHEAIDKAIDKAIDAAYHANYDRYGPAIVGSVVGPDAHRFTVRLTPDPKREHR